MSEQQWDSLVEKLQDPDSEPKVRRRACQQLANTRDPAVIPFLRNAYLQDDDEIVRQLAEGGLAALKAQRAGISARRLPISQRALRIIAVALAVLFGGSLILNVLAIVLDDDDDATVVAEITNLEPSDRDDLIAQINEQILQGKADAAALSEVIAHYYNTGEVKCDDDFNRPTGVAFSEVDLSVFRADLTPIAQKLNGVLLTLQAAQTRWDRTCFTQDVQIQDLTQARSELDIVEVNLEALAADLQYAVDNPPTPTPTPTMTHTPLPTLPPLPTSTPVREQSTALPSVTATATYTPTVAPTATNTPLPTVTPSPTATLPFPELDYSSILRELSQRYEIIGDLQNPYGTGMIDQWEKALDPQNAPSTSYCNLRPWPSQFAFDRAQLAELQKVTVADPELEKAVLLQQEGLELAYQARALYERDCFSQALGNSAEQGLDLARQAIEKLTESQWITDAIRARP